MNWLIVIGFLCVASWLIVRDIRLRPGLSSAIWIPTLWVGILASRPISTWFGSGEVDTLEGSPTDRLFFLLMICASMVILTRRGIQWGAVLKGNWPILLFYGYFLISVTWADDSFVSFKRWYKDLGGVFVALVILTEADPRQAIRAVFVRCGYVLIPLSVILIRYFPEIGRRYSRAGGLEAIGATFQKNSLGAMVLVCGLILLWDWLERRKQSFGALHLTRIDRFVPLCLLLIGVYLLYQSQSKTSMLCMAFGAMILMSEHFPWVRARLGKFGLYALVGGIGYYVFDSAFGVTEMVITSLGRDMTLTGRTEVWRELLSVKTDPVFGTGFCSFWSDDKYLSQLPYWVAFSAHNGYLETYIDGGWVGVFFLAVLLLATSSRVKRHLMTDDSYALVRFAVFVATLIGNFSESHFCRIGPLWFLFLLAAIEPSSVRMPFRTPTRVPEWKRNARDANEIDQPIGTL